MKPIVQSEDDIITYKFTVSNLGNETISNVDLSSNNLTLTGVFFDDDSFTVTVDSSGFSGASEINSVIILSNANVINRCIKFTIGKQCF